MMKSVRSVVLVAVGALALSACGLLSGLIPDQEISGGVLGLGGGVDVPLAASGVAVAAVQTSAVTTWVGTLQKEFTIEKLADVNIPNLFSPNALTETIELDRIVVRNPGADTGPFRVTGLELGGGFTVGGQPFTVPTSAVVADLSVLFDNPVCAAGVGDERVCTYTTAQNVPSVDLEFLSNQVRAYWNLLRASGGPVSVNLTVTVVLANPGLPAEATVTVTLRSAGATLEF